MAKRVELPLGAWGDVQAVLNLSREQLTGLCDHFASAESLRPFHTSFLNRVAETLGVEIDVARSVVVVAHFLLLRSQGEEVYVEEMLDDVREFVEKAASAEEKADFIAKFEEKRDLLKVLATPNAERIRAQKIQRLATGPEREVESIRTICQLRPLFEGPEGREEMQGLVPTVLLELEVSDVYGEQETLAFLLNEELLNEFERVVHRTREKLGQIRQKYGSDFVT
jgi:hypothetical protein